MTEPNFYAAPGAPLLDPKAAGPLTCPWCSASATPSAVAQSCGGCGRRFTLSAGPALDASVALAPYSGAPNVGVRWSIVVTYRFATLDPVGVMHGTLDPVVGLAPIDQSGIAYADVVSIAVWRKLAWVEPIIAVLVPLPIACLSAYGTILAAMKTGAGGAAILGGVALVFGLLGGWMVYRGVTIGRRYARIVGRWTSFTIPFEGSRSFHEQLFRRCGLAPPPIP